MSHPRSPIWILAVLPIAGMFGCDSDPVGDADPEPSPLTASLLTDQLTSPVHLAVAPAEAAPDARLFVVEQPGRIRILEADGTLRPDPFLDIRDRVSCCGERGLLSLAFHPQYPANGRFFVNFTDLAGNTRIEEFTVSEDPNVADESSSRLILEVLQPFPNHNGGLNRFGPDGMLYIGLGDGGSAGDPQENGQNPNTLLGTILRIDVDGGDPYGIPDDNPFVNLDHAQPEVWAYGLRNPWRFSFDPATNELYIADVGQNEWEEINRAPASEGGINYGWNIMEGRECFEAASCDTSGLRLPILQYSHAEGCSITGGHVYRGSALPDIRGHYFFADYCQGWVRSLEPSSGADPAVREWDLGDLGQITSFGEDAEGELYILTSNGRLYRIVEGA